MENHIIPLGEDHLLRLLKEYVEYYNKDRRHMSLNKSPPIHLKAHLEDTDLIQVK